MEYGRLAWRDGAPFSVDFSDIYFSRNDAVEEVREVYLGGNQLPSRWQPSTSFVIGETGFGAGLNFFLTAQAWCEHQADQRAVLHYISIEKHPLKSDDIRRAISPWSRLSPLVEELCRRLPVPREGLQRREFFNGRVVLTLAVGDAAAMLGTLAGTVDAWYLDGFAPRCNPEMWSDAVLSGLARLSRAGTTFSTFTASGDVRRRLIGHGFAVEKVAGFGGKRERMQGVYTASEQEPEQTPWFAHPAATNPRTVVVVGSGIAGMSAATALARRGISVSVVSEATTLGSSVLPAAVVAPKPGRGEHAYQRFATQGFGYSAVFFESLQKLGDAGWRPTGVLDILGSSVKELPDEFNAVCVDSDAARDISGLPRVECPNGAVFFPSAGSILPSMLLRAMASAPNDIEMRLGVVVESLSWDQGSWLLRGCDGAVLGKWDCVVLAQGWSAQPLLATLTSSVVEALRPVKGQASQIGGSGPWNTLRCAIRAGVQILPVGDGSVWAGSSYQRDICDDAVSEVEHSGNIDELNRSFNDWRVSSSHLRGGWSGVRLTSPDRCPVVGPVPDEGYFSATYADLKHGRTAALYPNAKYLPGIYSMTGFGSQGFVTSLLAAQLIADYLTGTPVCVDRNLRHSLHPARFLVKRLKTGSYFSES